MTIAKALESLLSEKDLKALVGLYFQGRPERTGRRGSDFAGYLFDSLPENPPESVVASDLIAVSLLDVSFGPSATDNLLNRGCLNPYLALNELPVGVDLWMRRDRIAKLREAFASLDNLYKVGPTKASKLLARKRPRLAPITDTHVEHFYGCKGWDFLDPLAECLSESETLVRSIDDLCPVEKTPNSSPSTLRLLDVAIWMTRSRARSAKDARKKVWGRPDPLG